MRNRPFVAGQTVFRMNVLAAIVEDPNPPRKRALRTPGRSTAEEAALEGIFQGHLPLSWNIICERAEDAARLPGTVHARVGIRQIGVVREVEALSPELHAVAFA